MSIQVLNSAEVEEIAGGPLPLALAAFAAGVKAGFTGTAVAGAVKTGVSIGIAGATAALAAEVISD